jgi:enoyl-CoA hydratase/carnithine racemase
MGSGREVTVLPSEDGKQHSSPAVRADVDGLVTTITMDSPLTKNACNGDMFVTLGALFRQASYSGARAIVLTGAGGNFCAGADLSGQQSDSADRQHHLTASMRVLAEVVLDIHSCPVPVVAKVDGLCVGAGLGVALAADMIWCSDRARLSAIFAKRGLSLDFGTSWFLRQRIGVHKAKQLVFTGEIFDGRRAFDLGLVNAVVPAADLDSEVAAVVDTIVAGPPIAISIMKRQLDNAGSASLAQCLEAEALAQNVNVHTEDFGEAMTSYFERRRPEFNGR